MAFLSRRLPLAHSLGLRTLKILAADPVDASCGRTFAEAGHKLIEKKMKEPELLSVISQYDGLVVRSGVKVTREIIEAGKGRLKVIGRAGAGTDNIDLKAATENGVVVLNTPGGNTAAAAELTMSLLMALARNLPAACDSLKKGAWERKKFGDGMELKGKTVGVIGLGQIGRSVAKHCQSLSMATLGYDPMMSKEAITAAGIVPATLEDMWAKCDIITLHTPLTPDTKNLISAKTLGKMKKGVIIVNAARGGIVNEADLLVALNSGQVRGAALDVFEVEPPPASARALIEHPSVLCTPHLGASTEEAQKKVAGEIAAQMCDAFKGTKYFGVVNAPHLNLAAKPTIAPYVSLSRSLGALLGQMVFPSGEPSQRPAKGTTVRVEVQGPVLATKGVAELCLVSVLHGLLPVLPFSDLEAGDVNLVNASALGAAAGLSSSAGSSIKAVGEEGVYENIVRVVLTPPGGTGERVVEGALIDGSPRVTQLDFWQSFPPFTPEGHVLVYNNVDAPGQVSKITKYLAEHNVNIASFNVARQYAGGGSPAFSILNCDTPIPARCVEDIKGIEGVSGVTMASFPA